MDVGECVLTIQSRNRLRNSQVIKARVGPDLRKMGIALTSGARGRRFDTCSCHVGFVVGKNPVRGFFRGSLVSFHFLHSTN